LKGPRSRKRLKFIFFEPQSRKVHLSTFFENSEVDASIVVKTPAAMRFGVSHEMAPTRKKRPHSLPEYPPESQMR